MPLQATSGAASYDGFGGGVAVVPTFIEDVFSCFLYTGTGASQTITNGIDLAGKGGLAWTKYRSGTNAAGHFLADSVRGIANTIQSNSEGDQQATSYYTAFNSNGFSISSTTEINYLNTLYASWTFRKQTKFFDIITYTGNGTSGTNIAHNLGSTPGCVMVKSTSTSRRWAVYHRGNGATPQNNFLNLNTTGASIASSVMWNNTAPTSTVFTLGSGTVVDAPTGEVTSTNENGVTYVAYIFAHNAGGFGLTGTDNVISCGSYVGTGAVGNAVALGYEPQWLMVKNVTSAFDWIMYDNMRGMPASATNTGETKFLRPNTSGAEAGGGTIIPTATGFQANTSYQGANFSGETYIYIAIRRGPMKVPTDGTKVFTPATRTGTGTATTITSAGFPVDLVIGNSRNAVSYGSTGAFGDRLRGKQNLLYSPFTSAEDTANVSITGFDVQNGISVGDTNAYSFNYSGGSYVNWFFRRAPSFFDEVCYTGTGANRTVSHNLGVAPEMIIVKSRNGGAGREWIIYAAPLGNTKALQFNTYGPNVDVGYWNNTTPSASTFTIGTEPFSNTSGELYVSYLFATCAGVSKVGSYTGTATTKQIDCGFAAGARFVLIKRTDSTGDWYVWDSARGIVSGNDPYLLLNSTAAEVTNTDYVDTYSAGFEISSTAPAAINASGGNFVFLAIA